MEVVELCEKYKDSRRAFFIALDSLMDHQNIASIIRSGVFFGAQALIAPRDRSAPLAHPTVWRVSQGAAEHIDLVEEVNLARTLNILKENGFWVIGASSHSEAKGLTTLKDWPQKVVVVLGSEDKGLRRLVQETCDFIFRIPGQGSRFVDSLNVSQAATLIFYEIYKSRL
jgi:23S rRNA (guanosine2251-2'-O)-methyltransferase